MTNTEIVQGVRDGDEAAMLALYALVGRVAKKRLARQLGALDFEDRLHDIYIAAVKFLRLTGLRREDSLPSALMTITRHHINEAISDRIDHRRDTWDADMTKQRAEQRGYAIDSASWENCAFQDQSPSPLDMLLAEEKKVCAVFAMGSIGRRHMEVLMRFYLLEQTKEQIRTELSLTETQFRLLKSRAKDKLGKAGQRLLKPKIRRMAA